MITFNHHCRLLILLLVIAFCGNLPGYSQAADQKVTIDLTDATLAQVFKSIEKQTTYRFSYKKSAIDATPDITVRMSDAPVGAVLDKALAGRNLSYSIVSDKSIVIVDKNSAGNSGKAAKGGVRISGIIVDNTDEPVIGASVRVKGSDKGTVTNIDGEYTLDGVVPGSTVDVSFIGYEGNKFKVEAGKSTYNIVLRENSQLLDEMVVVGYGTQKKSI